MIQLVVKNIFKNEEDGKLDFPENLSSLRCADRSIQMVYSVDLAMRKKSFAHTKERGDVSGTTKKVYRQKGTGGARHGTLRASQFRGGGVTFGPRFSERKIRINKKLRALAVLTCLNKHINRGSLFVVNDLKIDNFKTKNSLDKLRTFFSTKFNNENFDIEIFLKKTGCLFVDSVNLNDNVRNFSLSLRNVIGIKLIDDNAINVTDFLFHGVICVTLDALKKIIARFYEKLYLIK
jgi:large subunit ribosomal protein L4